MRILPLCLLVLGACGRIGFDPQASGDAAAIDSSSVDAAPDFDATQSVASGPFGPAEPVVELNSDSLDDDPSLTGDMLEVYFKSDRAGGGESDIYRAQRPNIGETFGEPIIVSELSGPGRDDTPEVSYDGLTIFISSSRDGNDDIYQSTRADRSQPWSVPVRIEELRSDDGDYAAARDGSGLYLVMTRAVESDLELFLSKRTSGNEPWDQPSRAFPLSTPGYQADGVLDERGLLLFYTSAASAEDDNRDLYVAARANPSEPFGIGQPIEELNTAGFDEDPWISPDLTTIYFVRESPGGTKDLFRATRPLSP